VVTTVLTSAGNALTGLVLVLVALWLVRRQVADLRSRRADVLPPRRAAYAPTAAVLVAAVVVLRLVAIAQ
jgi:uncharacterized membrane protein